MNVSVAGARHRDTVEEAGMAPGVAGIQEVGAPKSPTTAHGGAA